MRLAIFLLLLVVLAACDSSGLDPFVPPGPPPPGAIDTLATVRVEPRATYLRTFGDPGATATVAFALDSLGAAPGDTLTFYVTGYVDLGSADGSPTRSRDLLGVFAASGALAPADSLRRVVDAIDAGVDLVTDSTAVGEVPTDIAEDFFATRATVTVPAGATHLFLAVSDAFYSDNVDVGEGVRVNVLRRRR